MITLLKIPFFSQAFNDKIIYISVKIVTVLTFLYTGRKKSPFLYNFALNYKSYRL